ncbi:MULTISPECIES: type IV secretory system conjugative DNA transfer family protein [Vibrio harveyi group]|nr:MULTISPECIES: type IV secretory system conjugative DNA transfer family protein [Vibrio harveyi group]APX10124.1 hypothetical protein BWP24_28460 [Vibrio campbellii]ARR10587.1 conjugal transfer protein TraK [Vibrio campbellii]WHP52915.1 type IV secretory system conjugative DNA transfer family protein [Vibrio parahaemolyticus]
MKKVISVFLFFALCLAFGVVVGQYAGGFVFLKSAGMDVSKLSFYTLNQYYELYGENESVKKYIQLGYAVNISISVLPLILGLIHVVKRGSKEELHGSARFANDKELAKSGLIDEKQGKYPEVLIGRVAEGRHKGKLIRFRGQQFLGLSAPTRSGKGVGIVIPNLVNYSDSVVNNDIKFENFRKTAGFRQMCGQEVFLFSPDGYTITDLDRDKGVLRTHRWNPMSYIRRQNIYRIGDILAISAIFYPITGDKNDIWNELAGKLFKGLTLFMLDNEKLGMEVSFPQLLRLTTPEGGLDAWMKDQIENNLCSDDCKAEFYAFMAAPNETKGSILSNLVSPLAIFSDKVCAAATSADDFDLREVRKKQMSIYVGVQPTNTKKFSKLLNLFWSQLITENTRVQPEDDASLKYQCLLMLDEFTSLGRVSIIQESIGYTASYNMRYLLIYQSDAQLEEKKHYEREGAKVLKDNLAVELIYPPKKVTEHTKQLSETIGYKTVKHKSRSRSRGATDVATANVTDADREDKRALMLPQEIVELGYEKYMGVGLKEIVIMENMRPFIADKIIYFDDPAFMERVDYAKQNVPEIPLLDLSRYTDIKLVDGVKMPESEPVEAVEQSEPVEAVKPVEPVKQPVEEIKPEPIQKETETKPKEANDIVSENGLLGAASTGVAAGIGLVAATSIAESIEESSTIEMIDTETGEVKEIPRETVETQSTKAETSDNIEDNSMSEFESQGDMYDFEEDESLNFGGDDYGFDTDNPF